MKGRRPPRRPVSAYAGAGSSVPGGKRPGGRVLSILMALQAGLPLLDFSLIAEEKKPAYFAAIQAGLDKNYKPMERLFAEIIERSVASS